MKKDTEVRFEYDRDGKKKIRRKRSYLDVGEIHFEHVGGRVAGVEEHQLGFLQVVGRQALLNLNNNMSRSQQASTIKPSKNVLFSLSQCTLLSTSFVLICLSDVLE